MQLEKGQGGAAEQLSKWEAYLGILSSVVLSRIEARVFYVTLLVPPKQKEKRGTKKKKSSSLFSPGVVRRVRLCPRERVIKFLQFKLPALVRPWRRGFDLSCFNGRGNCSLRFDRK